MCHESAAFVGFNGKDCLPWKTRHQRSVLEDQMRFNPIRVSQQSLGSPQRGAPQVVRNCDLNPNGVSHRRLRTPVAIVEPHSEFNLRTMIGTQGAPLHGDPGLCCVTPLGFSIPCFAVLFVHELMTRLSKLLRIICLGSPGLSSGRVPSTYLTRNNSANQFLLIGHRK